MKKLDRALQREILEHLKDLYPNQTVNLAERFRVSAADRMYGQSGHDRVDFWGNVQYLIDHRLVAVKGTDPIGMSQGNRPAWITAKGLDFLEDDGGLGAILGVVTVRLEAETIRQLLAGRIEAASGAPEKKATLKARLGQLSIEALRRVLLRYVDAGVDRSLEFFEQILEAANPGGTGVPPGMTF